MVVRSTTVKRDRQHSHSIVGPSFQSIELKRRLRFSCTATAKNYDDDDENITPTTDCDDQRPKNEKMRNGMTVYEICTNTLTHTERSEETNKSKRLPLDVHRLSITPSLDVNLNGCIELKSRAYIY